MVFLSCFVFATSISPEKLSDEKRNSLLIATIVLGVIHLTVEVRQFIWKPLKYITDFWNYFDLGAYSLAISTSFLWLHYNNSPPVQLISASNLLLDLRLMLFLRAFRHFGAYFAIVIGVAKKDLNNPWNLVNRYYTYFANSNSYSQDSYLVQLPDGNTNMFSQFSSSILAMYNFLTGDNGAFGSRVLQDDPYLVVLVVAFSFIVVVYLMNLFIGLLSNEIGNYNTNETFMAQKAKIITEIELFYLLPNQRRWRNWFPDILLIKVPIDVIRKKIKEIDDSNEDAEYLPYIPDKLRKYVDVPKKNDHETIDFNSKFQQIEDKLRNNENNMKEMENRLLLQMQTLLKEINEIKNLKK
ncbi:13542_t:CDS:2 [Entrophospora sp. SA101]|nr:13542_t:CDS:2 [Entrophospora sp. SA101]